jgi:predicted dienelactone hydrolase
MWYPCAEPPGDIDLGEITAKFGVTLRGAKDCPISGDKLPLVAVSRGHGGQFFDPYDTIDTLAEAGFVVAAINHPRDSFGDVSPDLSVVVERPTDIKRLVDFMLDAALAASRIDPQRIGFFGYSAGGYTGLVLIGANIDWASLLCDRSSAASVCKQILRKEFRVQPLAQDARIKAGVIADPPGWFFDADSFAGVKVPVQLWASHRGR